MTDSEQQLLACGHEHRHLVRYGSGYHCARCTDSSHSMPSNTADRGSQPESRASGADSVPVSGKRNSECIAPIRMASVDEMLAQGTPEHHETPIASKGNADMLEQRLSATDRELVCMASGCDLPINHEGDHTNTFVSEERFAPTHGGTIKCTECGVSLTAKPGTIDESTLTCNCGKTLRWPPTVRTISEDDFEPNPAYAAILDAPVGPTSRAMLDAITAWGDACRSAGERAATERIVAIIDKVIDDRAGRVESASWDQAWSARDKFIEQERLLRGIRKRIVRLGVEA